MSPPGMLIRELSFEVNGPSCLITLTEFREGTGVYVSAADFADLGEIADDRTLARKLSERMTGLGVPLDLVGEGPGIDPRYLVLLDKLGTVRRSGWSATPLESDFSTFDDEGHRVKLPASALLHEFEAAIVPALDRVVEQGRKVLRDAALTPTAIDRVVLAGKAGVVLLLDRWLMDAFGCSVDFDAGARRDRPSDPPQLPSAPILAMRLRKQIAELVEKAEGFGDDAPACLAFVQRVLRVLIETRQSQPSASLFIATLAVVSFAPLYDLPHFSGDHAPLSSLWVEEEERSVRFRGESSDLKPAPANPVTSASDVTVDLIHFSITSPATLQVGQTHLVEVWAHLDGQREEILQRAMKSQKQDILRVGQKGPIRLRAGLPSVSGLTSRA